MRYQPEFERVSWHSAAGDNLSVALLEISVPLRKHSLRKGVRKQGSHLGHLDHFGHHYFKVARVMANSLH